MKRPVRTAIPVPLGIIGTGNMGEALLGGLIEENVLPVSRILLSESSPERKTAVKRRWRARFVSVCELAGQCSTIVLAVKPQQIREILAELRGTIRPETVVVSIAAGVPISLYESSFAPLHIPVVRVMPNLPVKVRTGIIAYTPGRYAKKSDGFIPALFEPLGTVFKVAENRMDFITAMCGSGPGYLFHLAEIIEKLCVNRGFSAKTGRRIAASLLIGAGRMIETSGESPLALKQRVSSPGGTTLAGLSVLERDLERLLMKTTGAAERRSRELSGKKTERR